MYADDRYSPAAAALSMVSLIVWTFVWQPLGKRPALAGLLCAHLLLTCLYFWSWDETHHVTVDVTSAGVVGHVDGDTLSLATRVDPGRVGVQLAPYVTYRIQATGEEVQGDDNSPLSQIARAFRLSQPSPAWSNLTYSPAAGAAHSVSLGPGLVTNSRRELGGSPGAYALTGTALTPPYRLSADLIRPDGAANLLVGVGPGGSGVALQVRFDQPDMLWAEWSNGTASAVQAGNTMRYMDTVAEIQRALRAVLPGYLLAVFLIAVATGAYPVLLALFNGFRPGRPDSLEPVRSALASKRVVVAAPALLTVAGLVATASVASTLLDRIPHVQDSVAYLFQAKIFASGHLAAPAPPPSLQPFFLEEYMPFHDGHWFSQYPPGHPLMLLIGLVFRAPWLVEPVAASLSIGAVYLLAREVHGPGTGLLAGALGLSSPFWLFLGSSFMAHATGLLFGSACLLCIARADARGAVRRYAVLAGFAAGMLFMTRQITAVGLLAPAGIYAAVRFRREARALALAAIGFAVPALALEAYNWKQMGSPLLSTYAAWSPNYTLGFGPHKAPAGAFTLADGVWNAYQNLSMLSPQAFGWPYGVAFGIMSVPFLTGAARRWDWLLLAGLVSLVCVHMLYWCPCLMFGPRFYYEGLPAVFVLTARGFIELYRLPLRIWPSLGSVIDETIAGFVPAVLLATLLVFNLRFYLPPQLNLYKNYNYSSDAELNAVRSANIHHAVVFVVSNPAGFWASYGNVFFANSPDLSGDVVFAHDLGVADTSLFRFYPHRAYYRLNGTTLTPLRG